MSTVFDLADRFVRDAAAADPFAATFWGVTGHDDSVTDYSPAGFDRRADLARGAVAALDAAAVDGDADRIARDFMRERLTAELDDWAAGNHLRDLRNFGSAVQAPRQAFDLAPKATADDWEAIATRLGRVHESIDGLIESLRLGLDRGLVAARRQALVCTTQAATWAGEDGSPSYFARLAEQAPAGARDRVAKGGDDAAAAYARLADFLRREYSPKAAETDGVGEERYRLAARLWLGADIDLRETYEWGWEELHRLEREMARVAERIRPGASREEAIELLRTDPARAVRGVAPLLAFLQDMTDRTIAELAGRHFDIAPELRRVECMEAPPGGAAAMYYTPPSEDFSRPGRTWYPTLGKEVFPLWVEVSTAYHEGVPGHHLQLGLLRTIPERLSRYQSLMGWVSGHGEGWALYAERLMHELGYFENPDYEMGFLACQIFRAMRVVVDIGLHLGLAIPASEKEHGGEVWSWDLARPFVERYTPQPGDFAQSELERYCGMPGQAISYKVGEREWLDIRERCRERDGAAFDLKAWHMRALEMGPMGLAQMRSELLRG